MKAMKKSRNKGGYVEEETLDFYGLILHTFYG